MASAPPLVVTDCASTIQKGSSVVAKPSSAVDDGKAQISNSSMQGQASTESAKVRAVLDTVHLPADGTNRNPGKVNRRAAVKMTFKHPHSEMPNKKRRINEDRQQRRIRTSNFEALSIRNVNAEVFNRDIGFLPREQGGILGGGPSSQLRDSGIIEWRPLAQLRDHAVAGSGWPTYQAREQGIVEAGFASQLREHGVPSGRWLTSEQGIVPGWSAAQVGQPGLLGRAPSLAHIGSERFLPLQAPGGGRVVDQDQFNNLGGSLPGEPGILGGGPFPQLRETAMLPAAQLREQGLLGRWPSSSPVGFEGVPTFQTLQDGRIMDRNVKAELTFNAHSHERFGDHEQYESVGAPKLTFQAQSKRRYMQRKHYRSVGVPDLAHQVHQNGAYVDKEHYESVNTPVLPLQVFHNGRHIVPVPNSWEYDLGMRSFA